MIGEASSPSLAWSTRPGISSGKPSPNPSISRRFGVEQLDAPVELSLAEARTFDGAIVLLRYARP
jgi:hypothetical protein